jgi:hypothetical protein
MIVSEYGYTPIVEFIECVLYESHMQCSSVRKVWKNLETNFPGSQFQAQQAPVNLLI